MYGLMMQQPLLISSLLTHAERHHGEQEVVSRRVEGDLHRTTYRELAARSRRMANVLAARGINFGDRVATLAWNGYRHPKWDERPLLVVVKKPRAEVTRDELIRFYDGKIAKWGTPDDVVFVDAIPLGATGKMQKNKLREQFADHKLPTA